MSESKGLRHIRKDNFDDLINGDKPVLVDFYATWCGPCQMMAPVIEEIAKEEADKTFIVSKLDIDEVPNIAAKYDVMSVPTFMVFKKGKEAARMIGAMPKEMIIERIKSS